MAAVDFGLPSSLLFPTESAGPSSTAIHDSDAFLPTGLLLQGATTTEESGVEVAAGAGDSDAFGGTSSSLVMHILQMIQCGLGSHLDSPQMHHSCLWKPTGSPPLLIRSLSLSLNLNLKVCYLIVLCSRQLPTPLRQDDEMPDVAELLKSYTTKVASLKPIPSSSKILTTTTFNGSAIYFTRKPRRTPATSALVSAPTYPTRQRYQTGGYIDREERVCCSRTHNSRLCLMFPYTKCSTTCLPLQQRN